MKRGRKPRDLDADPLLRRSGRSRKESFKIKLFNATKGKLASTELVKSEMDENGNDIQTVAVKDHPVEVIPVTPKRKRGRPRKYPVSVKEDPRDFLADALCTISSPIEALVPDVSTDLSSNGEYFEFPERVSPVHGGKLFKQKSGLASPQLKPKKTYTYEPILPPCKVCGAKASGYHFGAITCEACKVFFRRSLTRQTSYHCNNDGNCKILSNRRISCSYCRLKKCGELGMSRDGIQRGRYTVERKTECIRKVKELEILQQVKAAEEECLEDDDSHSHEAEPFLTPKIEVDTELETLIKAVVKADSECLMVDEHHMNQLLEMQANYLEYLKLRESVFGPMESLSSEEYHEVYKNTGIDLGNRRQKFAKCVFSFVHKITKFIEFAKSLPEFLKLSMTDQITLLREGMLDWVLLSGFEAFNSESLVFTCSSCHHTWSKDEFESLKDKRFFFQSFVATAAVKKLHLHKDELAILKALVIFSPDGSEGQVEDRTFIEKYQQRLTDSLLVTLQRNHQHLSNRHLAVLFGRIICCLTEVRDASIRYKQLMDECLDHFPDIEYPELFVEILGDELKVKLDSARAACITQNASLRSSTTLSPSSCESSLSPDSQMSPEISGDNIPLWSTQAPVIVEPVIVEPTYRDHLPSNFLSQDGNMFGNFVNSLSETSIDYSIASSFMEANDAGTDRVLLLAQL